MKLNLRKAVISDKKLLYDLVLELSNPKILKETIFNDFFENILELKSSDIWVFENKEDIIGYALVNRSVQLRYLGFVVEIEEIVVSKKFRRKGYGEKFIYLLKEEYKSDLNCRKLGIKTNDLNGSARLYRRLFDETDLIYFQIFLNRI
ncbi:MAG TPA: hypothetical protein DCL80_03545 [Balneola sp.]|jgi:N-acetylglutamate synthase-like GNAT family acetyltransferase|nr:hypothetical protein [Balneola sp.]MAO77150.1 hypothetical protein [Balneola sp.]MBF63401.1 hypothetical protein [Balneola sp.]HAH50369.1 hypothetical protein [Balneola sp.]HAW79450.1 hypothetical protein [Balneola sp.]|tara:strand:+ start:10996 stop:11439 length:444 start_codon:yes stop_codon:yes gene_type:complete